MAAVMMPGAPGRGGRVRGSRAAHQALREAGQPLGLGTILVGSDSASEGYIRIKQRKAEELGCSSPHIHLPDDATQADLLAAIRDFNADPAVDGFLVQHPTPPQIDFDAALLEIDPDKDVDGLHPVNVGRLALSMPGPCRARRRGSRRCSRTTRSRSRATRWSSWAAAPPSAGRSPSCCRRSARPRMRRSPWSTPACPTGRVHEAGRDRRRRGRACRGSPARAHHPGRGRGRRWGALRGPQLLPDVDERCEEVAGYITPRVGGVGPTTIAMLFRNAVEAAERKKGDGSGH